MSDLHIEEVGSRTHEHPDGTTRPVRACVAYDFDDAIDYLRSCVDAPASPSD